MGLSINAISQNIYNENTDESKQISEAREKSRVDLCEKKVGYKFEKLLEDVILLCETLKYVTKVIIISYGD